MEKTLCFCSFRFAHYIITWMLQDVARVWKMLADVALKRCVRFAGP